MTPAEGDSSITALAAAAGFTPPAAADTDDGAAAEPPALAMSAAQIDVSGLVTPAARPRSYYQQAAASRPGEAPDSCGAQIAQIWILSFLTGIEPASVQNGRDVRVTKCEVFTPCDVEMYAASA